VRVVTYGEVTTEVLRRSSVCLRDNRRQELHWGGLVGECVPVPPAEYARMTGMMQQRATAYLEDLVGPPDRVVSILTAGERLGCPGEEMLAVGLRAMLLDLSVGHVVNTQNLLEIDRHFYVLSLPDRTTPRKQFGVRFVPLPDRWLARMWSDPGRPRLLPPAAEDARAALRLAAGRTITPEERLRLQYHGLAGRDGRVRLLDFADRMVEVARRLTASAEGAVDRHVRTLLAAWDEPALKLAQLRVIYEMANDCLPEYLPQFRDVLLEEDPIDWWTWQGDNPWVSALVDARERSRRGPK